MHKYGQLQFGVAHREWQCPKRTGQHTRRRYIRRDVYVDQENQVVQYSSTGELLTVSNGGEETISGSFGVAAAGGHRVRLR